MGLDISSMLAANAAAQGLDPATLAGVVSTAGGNTGVAVQNAQATQAFGDATRMKNNMASLSPSDQASSFNSLSQSDQQMLRQAGYKLPVVQTHHGGGWFGHLLSDVSNRIAAIPHGFAQLFSDTSHVVGEGLNLAQHAYRAGNLIQDQVVGSANRSGVLSLDELKGLFNPHAWQAAFTPSDWAQAWDHSQNGEKTFLPSVLSQLEKQYNPNDVNLAKIIASGTPRNWGGSTLAPSVLAQIEKQVPPGPNQAAQQQALAQRVNTDPTLRAIVNQLQGAKISFGQSLVGQHFMVTHPEAAHIISGTADAVGDFYADPFNRVLGLAHDARMARFVVGDTSQAADKIATNPDIQRALGHIAGFVGRGDVAGLRSSMPSITALIPDLVHAGADTTQKVGDYMVSAAGWRQIMMGHAGGLTQTSSVMLPHLSPLGLKALEAKGTFNRSINWMDDNSAQIAARLGITTPQGAAEAGVSLAPGLGARTLSHVGASIHSITRLIPKGTEFDPSSAQATETIGRLADLFLPSRLSAKLQSAFAGSDTLGAKKNIYMGMLSDMGRAAGISDSNSEWKAVLGRIETQINSSLGSRIYSAATDAVGGRVDAALIDGENRAVGFLEPHLTTNWGLPDLKTMAAISNADNFAARIGRKVNNDVFSAFMDRAWKPLLLLRFGFPIRAGGEELFGAILRHGPGALLKARLAAGAVKGLNSQSDAIVPPLAWMYRSLTSHLGDGAVNKEVTNARDMVASHVADHVRRQFRNVEGALAGPQYMAAAQHLYDSGGLASSIANELSAVGHNGLGYLDSVQTRTLNMRNGRRTFRAQMTPTGNFVGLTPSDGALYLQAYKHQLDQVANSAWARQVLINFDAPRADQVQAVADALAASPAMASRSLRWDRNRAGEIVGSDITRQQALMDWANVIVDHTRDLVTAPDGHELPGIVRYMLNNREAPSKDMFGSIPEENLPRSVTGPETVPVPISKYSEIVQKGFDTIVGRPMNWMIREPLFIHNYALARANVTKGLTPLLGTGSQAAQTIHDVSMERALRASIPFVHDPQLRTHFAVNVRNLAPFWFAQEQFYKRWARNFRYSPAAFAKAQLLMGGLRHSGLIHTDDQGNDYFMYPVVGSVVQNALVKGFGAFGIQASLPISAGFSGDVKFVSPGLERLGLPSFGPLVSVPLKFVTQAFPELTPVDKALLGRGASTPIVDQLIPTTFSRIYHAFADTPQSSHQYASAMMQAMAYLSANGYEPPDNANAQALDDYVQRVKNWTRILFVTRTILGFAAPASPTINLDPKHLNPELRGLMQAMPVSEAMSTFLARHPDATAYTVAQSESPGKATPPATAAALGFMQDHEAFLKAHRLAGSWFIPMTSGVFDQTAYQEGLALGLRAQKAPRQYISDVKYAEGANDYFPSYDNYKAALLANPTQKSAVDKSWTAWKTRYFAEHPIFADQYQAANGHQTRMAVETDIMNALADPRLPNNSQSRAIKDLITSFQTYQNIENQMKGQRGAQFTEQRRANSDQFNSWVKPFLAANPSVMPLYHKIIAPEVTTYA